MLRPRRSVWNGVTSGAQGVTNGVKRDAQGVTNGVKRDVEAAQRPLGLVELLAQSNSNAVGQESTGLPTDQDTVIKPRCPAGEIGVDVRFGSLADNLRRLPYVRFTPKSRHSDY
jgi:hypothetical protein